MYEAMLARNLRVTSTNVVLVLLRLFKYLTLQRCCCQLTMQAALAEEPLCGTAWTKYNDGKHPYFVHAGIGAIRWKPPAELYYFLPQMLEQQLQCCLSLSEIETMKVSCTSQVLKVLAFARVLRYLIHVIVQFCADVLLGGGLRRRRD